MDFFHNTGRYPIAWCLIKFLLLLCFIEIPVFIANSVDPDQKPHSVVSALGLHCLQVTLLGVSRLK